MVEIQNSTKERIRVKQLKTLAERILKKEKSGKKDLSAVLVSPQKMRELNKVWRDKDKATNVLAFPGGKEALGEIVLCPFVIRKDALE